MTQTPVPQQTTIPQPAVQEPAPQEPFAQQHTAQLPTTQPTAAYSSQAPGPSTPTAFQQVADVVRSAARIQWTKRLVWGGLGAVVVLSMIVSTLIDTEEEEPRAFADPAAVAATTEPPEAAAAPAAPAETADPAEEAPRVEEKAPATPRAPKSQRKFISAVAEAADSARNADNDLQVGAALTRRNEAICDAVGDGTVSNWVGTVKTLDSNGDGYGILKVEFGDDIEAGTWNNAFSDISDGTLIKPGKLYDDIVELSEGDTIKFSGKFKADDESCAYASNLTRTFNLSSPDFIMSFTSVKTIG